MINETFEVTFGVELETVLAFHETLLRRHLQSTSKRFEIIKNIPDDIRKELNLAPALYRRYYPKYMGWGLTTSASSDEIDVRTFQESEDKRAKLGYRAYAGEILTLAKTLLLPEDIRMYFGKGDPDYRFWHLTHDTSLVGVSKAVLTKNLRLADREIDDIEDWDSHGVELVSRVLPFESASFHEINTYLTRLFGTPSSQHLAMVTECCGLHVHVGLPPPADHTEGTPPPTFSLPTLQHLAYILVMYEIPLRALFPKWRFDGSNAGKHDLHTNLGNFFEEPMGEDWDPKKDNFHVTNPTPSATDSDNKPAVADILSKAHISMKKDDSKSNAKITTPSAPAAIDPNLSPSGPFCPTIPFSTARSKIFSPNMTVPKLATLMSPTRAYLVNFKYLLRQDGSPRTLEFRQHEGCLNLSSLKSWVTFVVGLVRLAEYNGRVYGVGHEGVGD